MAAPRALGSVTITAGTPTPVLLNMLATVAAVSFSITNNIATINLGATNLPKTGYNGPRGFGNAGPDLGVPGQGQQVILWGFTTASYFNGKIVTVLDNDGSGQFRFAFTHANVGSTNDAGSTAPMPFEQYRKVRIQSGASNGATDKIYVGDGSVSSSKYIAAIVGPNNVWPGDDTMQNDVNTFLASRLFLDGTSSSDTVQVSVIH